MRRRRTSDERAVEEANLHQEPPRKKNKQNREQEIEQKLQQELSEFISDGWSPLKDSLINSRLSIAPKSTVNYSCVNRLWCFNPQKIMDKLLPVAFWQNLASIVNNNIDSKKSRQKVADTSTKYYKQVTPSMMKMFYGILLQLENMYSEANHSITANYKYLRNQKKTPMGYQRFRAILSCLNPLETEFNQLIDIIRASFKECWSNPVHVAADEALYGYQPSKETKKKYEKKKDPIPVVYIPRKPHPNGLLNYKLVVKSEKTKKPYVLDFQPKFINTTSSEALEGFINRWSYTTTPHFIVDAGIGTFDIMEKIEEKSFYMTMASKSNSKPFLWNLLKRDTHIGCWNAAGKGNIMASIRNTNEENSERKYHHLLTNLFSFQVYDPFDFENNERLEYSRKDLEKKKALQLKEILSQNHLKKSGTKETLIQRIIDCCNPLSSTFEKVLNIIESINFLNKPEHHEIYRQYFNGVDLHDKKWYRFHYSYGINNWRSKMLLCILTDAIINCYTIVNENRKRSLLQVREDIIESFLLG